MKRIFIAVVCICILNICKAQTKIGIRAGYTYSNAKIVENGIKQKTQYISGYTAGITFKAPFEGVLHSSSSINFSHRGFSYTPSTGTIQKIENKINYIDLEPGLSLDFTTGPGSAFIIGFGPMLSIAISGEEKHTLANGTVTTNKMVFDYNNYSKFDAGITGNIGYKFKDKIVLEAALFFSPANIENDENLKRNIQARMYSFTIGYYLK